jgi:hypothetical protein
MRKGNLFAVTLCAILFASCGPKWDRGEMKTEQKQPGSFTAVDISAPVDVVITIQPGATPSVALKGFSEDRKSIKTEVADNTLSIYSEDDPEAWIIDFGDERVQVEITVSTLTGLSIAGSSDVKTFGSIKTPSFSLDVAGKADVKIEELITDRLVVDAAGAADIDIKNGSARQAEYSFSGAGDLNAYGLKSEEVSAEVSGAGDMKLTVNHTLSASISGLGSIHYKGHPTVNKDVSGIGTISEAN